MELAVFDQRGRETGAITVSDQVFSSDFNEDLVHQLVVSHRSNARLGTRAQKSRATVAHSTRKPWRQKGTGRARAGMTSSPIWRGGGRAFPASPSENFVKKVNRKMYRVGMCCIYSQLIRDGRLKILDELEIDTPKTKRFLEFLCSFGVTKGLVCTDKLSDNIYLSSRNLPDVVVLQPRQADPVSLIRNHSIFLTREALLTVEKDLLC